MAGDVILGYDGQEGSEAALAHRDRASPPRSRLRSSSSSATGRRRSEATSPTSARAVRALGERITAEALDAVRTLDPSVTAEVELVDDRPAEAILRAADEHDALAIVVGATGRGPLTGALLGIGHLQRRAPLDPAGRRGAGPGGLSLEQLRRARVAAGFSSHTVWSGGT